MTPEQKFRTIADNLTTHEGVTVGRMMSAPGIQYNNKNFAFYHRSEMVFRMGREWKPEEMGIREWNHLSPFKSKPPLYDWFCIAANDADLWPELARMALSRMVTGK